MHVSSISVFADADTPDPFILQLNDETICIRLDNTINLHFDSTSEFDAFVGKLCMMAELVTTTPATYHHSGTGVGNGWSLDDQAGDDMTARTVLELVR